MNFVIWSGHRKSVTIAFDSGASISHDGKPLAVAFSDKNLNLHAYSEEELSGVVDHLLSGVREVCLPAIRDQQYSESDRLVVVIPGISTMSDLDQAERHVNGSAWPTAFDNFHIIDDTYAGLVAGALSTKGICAIAGTGASVYFGSSDNDRLPFAPDKSRKFDGWGPLLGDHGSGFRMALQTLDELCRWIDFRQSPCAPANPIAMPIVYQELIASLYSLEFGTSPQFGTRSLQNIVDDLLSNRRPEWRFGIANLASIITEFAKKGDAVAVRAVVAAADQLASTIREGLRLPHLEDHQELATPIYCLGGMFRYSEIYFDAVQSSLREGGMRNILVPARYHVAIGGLLISLAADWTTPSDMDVSTVHSSIQQCEPEIRKFLLGEPSTIDSCPPRSRQQD